jgi:hypothetical protein
MYERLSFFWERIQGTLFPLIEETIGPLTEKQINLVSVLELIRIESFVCKSFKSVGRPTKDRIALARSFVAKSLFNIPTTRMLIDRLKSDFTLRMICGFESRNQVPCESTFSRAFSEFAKYNLPNLVHEALVRKAFDGHIVGHISRDSTAIIAHEKPVPNEKKYKPKQKPSRLDNQLIMSQQERLDDLPKDCNKGAKADSKGRPLYWTGYRCHIDIADNDIPLSCIVTSASVHDSQVAIPLATETASKVASLYDLMDSAYYCSQIIEYSKKLGHVPIIEINARTKPAKEVKHEETKSLKTLNWVYPEKVRFRQRSSAERVMGRLKENFGGKVVRVKGHIKVTCHLMFGILALTAHSLLNIVR